MSLLGVQMLRSSLFFPVVLVFLPALAAQEFRGTITGRIIDSQSAAVPNARVTAVLSSTGAQSVTASGPDGLFTIPFLAPGSYRVEAEAPADRTWSCSK